MRLLYFSYWGIDDPLTIATVLPHVSILTRLPIVDKVILCTMERRVSSASPPHFNDKTVHRPILSGSGSWNKLEDLLKIPRSLRNLVEQESVDLVICRSAMAGSFAYLAFKDRMQVYIESFEPHAEYMLASGIWKKYDPRYLLQRRMEKAQKDTAAGIMTVSESYRKQLISEGISPGRVRAVPCAVKPDLYAYNPAERASTRLKLAISDHEIAGIYAGKLGGLYYMRQALQCFATIYSRLENFRLILLTYHDHREIIQGLASRGVPRELYTIEKVSPQQVPAYLSAADFGFCFHRSHDYSKAFGPVKNGEYWASGLPIMIPGNIGDDSDIAVSENAGATFSVNDTQSIADGISKIQDIIREPSSRKRIGEIAIKYKSFSTVSAAYQYFLNTKNQSNNA